MKWIRAAALIIICWGLEAEAMTILITSTSRQKISAVKEAFQNHFPEDEIAFINYDAASGIPSQPVGDDTAHKGVRNRLDCIPLDLLKEANYAVSIENYIEEDVTTHQWKDIGLVLLKDYETGNEFIIHSDPIEIPEKFISLARELSLEITAEGFSCTIGNAIHQMDEMIDPQDWHREAQFGGVSRASLLTQAISRALETQIQDKRTSP